MKYLVLLIFVTSMALFNVIVGIILAFFTPKRNPFFGITNTITLKDDDTWEFANKTYGLISLGLGGLGIALIIPLMLSLDVLPISKVLPIVLLSGIGLMFMARFIVMSLTKKKNNVLK